MGKLEPLTVAIPEDLAAALRAAVERGEFASESEAVTAALHEWLHWQGGESPEEIARLRRLVEEGEARGVSDHRSMDEILAEARQRDGRRRA